MKFRESGRHSAKCLYISRSFAYRINYQYSLQLLTDDHEFVIDMEYLRLKETKFLHYFSNSTIMDLFNNSSGKNTLLQFGFISGTLGDIILENIALSCIYYNDKNVVIVICPKKDIKINKFSLSIFKINDYD